MGSVNCSNLCGVSLQRSSGTERIHITHRVGLGRSTGTQENRLETEHCEPRWAGKRAGWKKINNLKNIIYVTSFTGRNAFAFFAVFYLTQMLQDVFFVLNRDVYLQRCLFWNLALVDPTKSPSLLNPSCLCLPSGDLPISIIWYYHRLWQCFVTSCPSSGTLIFSA